MGFLYMMVRLPNQEVLQKIIASAVAEGLPFSVGTKPEDLVAMAKQQFGFGENGDLQYENTVESRTIDNGEQHAEDIMEEDNTSYQMANTSEPGEQYTVGLNGEINAFDLLFEDEIKPPAMETVTVGEVLKGSRSSHPVATEENGVKKRSRSPNNIKRYRKQECKICRKFFMVPFWKTKVQHAAIHSEYKRYACIFCPKRVVHSFTIRTHVSKFHPFVEHAGRTGIGYQDLITDKEQEELEELTKRCFPDASQGPSQ